MSSGCTPNHELERTVSHRGFGSERSAAAQLDRLSDRFT